jgi:PPOX class probable FMN-dependent enzyme
MNQLSDPKSVRAHYGKVHPLAIAKVLTRIDRHARAFIALSPFLVVASADGQGRADAAPRGDAPGFVAVADDRTLLIPDRPGNNRVDTLTNIAENANIGLLFFVPGLIETLRVNGKAAITTDPQRLSALAVDGKPPQSALIVTVEEVFFHCGKALIRSGLWDAGRQIERSDFPTLGRIIADQIADVDAGAADQAIEADYRTGLY